MGTCGMGATLVIVLTVAGRAATTAPPIGGRTTVRAPPHALFASTPCRPIRKPVPPRDLFPHGRTIPLNEPGETNMATKILAGVVAVVVLGLTGGGVYL